MGYTHSWRRELELEPKAFGAAVTDCAAVLAECRKRGIRIGDGMGEGEPLLDATAIVFNGVGAEGCETFAVELSLPERERWGGLQEGLGGLEFQFCKTRYQPYDLAVMACLLVLKHHLGRAIRIGSDGGIHDWQQGIELAEQVLGVEFGEMEFADDGGGWQSLERVA